MLAAIVLAAGLSQRMGQPKMVLSWGKKTVIGQVVDTLGEGGIEKIAVVTGGTQHEVQQALKDRDVSFVYNPDYGNGEMLKSLPVGIQSLEISVDAVLMVLGDQPQREPGTVRLICDHYLQKKGELIIPSYQMRRGHPWLIGRPFWEELLALHSPATLRDFLDRFEKEISYLVVDTPTILKDLDTPGDYQRDRPQ